MADLIDRKKIKARFEPWLKVKGYSEGELNMLKAVLYEITIMPSAQPERNTECWIASKSDDAAKRLNDLILDINPAEICAQIEADNLKKWCEIIQIEMKMAMVQLPCWGEGEQDE